MVLVILIFGLGAALTHWFWVKRLRGRDSDAEGAAGLRGGAVMEWLGSANGQVTSATGKRRLKKGLALHHGGRCSGAVFTTSRRAAVVQWAGATVLRFAVSNHRNCFGL